MAKRNNKSKGASKKNFVQKRGENKRFSSKKNRPKKDFDSESQGKKPTGFSKDKTSEKDNFKKSFPKFRKKSSGDKVGKDDGLIRLNKFIANAGTCSRREADELIKIGAVKVNGKIVTEMGTRIHPTDKVVVGEEAVRQERLVYILLNKSKDYLSTVEDPQGRKTVLHLIANACKERVYPVGKLDRTATGLLMLTNDGDLTKKLTNPNSKTEKIYKITTDKSVTKEHLNQLLKGVKFEEATIKFEEAVYANDGESKKVLGINTFVGRNSVIKGVFETLGYKVLKLDRVVFAGLTKKDLPRGKWRFLHPKEVAELKKYGRILS